MKFVYLLFAACIMLQANATAQSFVNGSFESANTSPGSCNYFHNTGLAAYTSSADTGFGTADNIAYIGAPGMSCNYGDADNGVAYLALSANNAKYDAIAMKVSPAMTAGKHYVVSFKYKSSMSGPLVTMALGYSATNNAPGTLIAAVPTPANSDTNWKSKSYPFSPTIAAGWITLKLDLNSLAGYSFIEIDNFKLEYAEDVETTKSHAAFSISPNPAKGYTVIHAQGKAVSVTVTDITGRLYRSAKYQPQNNPIKLDVSDIPAGLYLVRLDDGSNVSVEKLQVQ